MAEVHTKGSSSVVEGAAYTSMGRQVRYAARGVTEPSRHPWKPYVYGASVVSRRPIPRDQVAVKGAPDRFAL